MSKYNETVNNNLAFVKQFKKVLEVANFLDYDFRTVEGDLTLYTLSYLHHSPFRFTLHFIKTLLHKRRFVIEYDKTCAVSVVKTAEHLYRDNLAPLLLELDANAIEYGVCTCNRSETFDMGFNRISQSLKLKFRIITLIKLSELPMIFSFGLFKYIIFLYYYKYIVQVDRIELERAVLDVITPKLKIVISAEVCDTYSRVFSRLAIDANLCSILLQCGPLFKDRSVEIYSIICTNFFAWHMSLGFFDDLMKNGEFQPDYDLCFGSTPRFTNRNLCLHKREYDIIVFLPWINFLSEVQAINNEILTTIRAIQATDLRFAIKFHPASYQGQNMWLESKFSELNILDSNASSIELIRSTVAVLNFGSTTTFDAVNMRVKVGIVNISGRIEPDSIYFSDQSVFNIKSVEDLNIFVSGVGQTSISDGYITEVSGNELIDLIKFELQK